MKNSVSKPSVHEAAWELLQQARLQEDEVNHRLQQAVSPSYWESLNPRLSVGKNKDCNNIENTTLSAECQSGLLDMLAKHGYFQTDPVIKGPLIESLQDCVEVLKREGWPLVFAFVYDQFWLIPRAPSFVKFLTGVLGVHYKQMMPWIWVHYINSNSAQAGWRPHVDGYHTAKRLTLWIPLTDATLDNGCIYVVPKSVASEEVVKAFTEAESVSMADLKELLQASRALLAPAGSVVGWAFDVIHWGSFNQGAKIPRIAFSQSFIAETEIPERDEIPLTDGSGLPPPFSQRLIAVAKAIKSYKRFEPLMTRYVGLADRLKEFIIANERSF